MRRLALLVLTALFVVGCSGDDDGTGPDDTPDYEGVYVLTGTINGFPNEDVAGTISLSGQEGRDIDYTVTVNFRRGGTPFFTIFTQAPGTAHVGSDGSLTMPISGSFNGVAYQLQVAGTLNQSGTMNGSWTLATATGTVAGNFSAQRQ